MVSLAFGLSHRRLDRGSIDAVIRTRDQRALRGWSIAFRQVDGRYARLVVVRIRALKVLEAYGWNVDPAPPIEIADFKNGLADV